MELINHTESAVSFPSVDTFLLASNASNSSSLSDLLQGFLFL